LQCGSTITCSSIGTTIHRTSDDWALMLTTGFAQPILLSGNWHSLKGTTIFCPNEVLAFIKLSLSRKHSWLEFYENAHRLEASPQHQHVKNNSMPPGLVLVVVSYLLLCVVNEGPLVGLLPCADHPNIHVPWSSDHCQLTLHKMGLSMTPTPPVTNRNLH
jgi:hypothetical protein